MELPITFTHRFNEIIAGKPMVKNIGGSLDNFPKIRWQPIRIGWVIQRGAESPEQSVSFRFTDALLYVLSEWSPKILWAMQQERVKC